ncbi:S41 family peptidase, partial [Candidatus Sumerlaeota bacterium]|nr:S41 family peptidase [Candidatus Sumerlaeota bacterium]
TVIAPIPGTPAAKAGIQPMDRIVKIDGQSTEGITLLEAVKKLTGATGSEVKVDVFREGATDLLQFTLVRDMIKVESVFHKVLNDDIGYIRIARFAEGTASDVKAALEEFKKLPLKGVIVDLRYDSGGLLDKVVEICDYFLPKGQIVVSTKGRKEENNREFYATNGPLNELPMAVLVNRGSASASEIFAGAMQDTKRGIIFGPKGQKTFGKGSVQTISYLKHSLERKENGEPRLSGLRLTTALYYTPSGRTIHNIGITPDMEVPVTREDELTLIRHGLLGDPDTTQFAEEDANAPADGNEEKKDSDAAPEEAPKPAEEKPKPEKKSPPKEFHDVILDEALKYLHEHPQGAEQAKS